MTTQDKNYTSVIEWLKKWAAAVRDNDLRKGRTMFCKKASGFGTITHITHDLDDLIKRQWTDVWKNTNDFEFDWRQIKVHQSPDGLQASVQALWASENIAGKNRTGRATIILQRTSERDEWKCVHTHFSLCPSGADPGMLK